MRALHRVLWVLHLCAQSCSAIGWLAGFSENFQIDELALSIKNVTAENAEFRRVRQFTAHVTRETHLACKATTSELPKYVTVLVLCLNIWSIDTKQLYSAVCNKIENKPSSVSTRAVEYSNSEVLTLMWPSGKTGVPISPASTCFACKARLFLVWYERDLGYM